MSDRSDLARAGAEEAGASAADLAATVADLDVADAETADLASELLGLVKARLRALEELRKRATAPLLEAKREVDSWFARPRALLEGCERDVKRRLIDYREAARADAVVTSEALRLEAESSAAGGDAVGAAERLTEAADAAEPVRVAGVQFRTTWDYELEDLAEVPREYLALDGPGVRAAVAAGVREIPGIRIYSRQVAAVR